jgi:hypothetical protein
MTATEVAWLTAVSTDNWIHQAAILYYPPTLLLVSSLEKKIDREKLTVTWSLLLRDVVSLRYFVVKGMAVHGKPMQHHNLRAVSDLELITLALHLE